MNLRIRLSWTALYPLTLLFLFRPILVVRGQMDPPHDGSRSISCYSCHLTHYLFGDQFEGPSGNANLCLSCHLEGGLASMKPLHQGAQSEPWPNPGNTVGKGKSHRWDGNPAGRVVFLGVGSGGNGIVPSGTYTGRFPRTYTITITASGSASTARFEWAAVGIGGGAGTNALCGTAVPIEQGIAVTFVNFRSPPAFRVGDRWQLFVRPGTHAPSDPLVVAGLEEGRLACSTCHDPHSQLAAPFDPQAPLYGSSGTGEGRNYMRIDNHDDQLCRECHAPFFAANAAPAIHPVGVTVASNAVFHPPAGLPLQQGTGRVLCSTCHTMHGSASDDGTLVRAARQEELCSECHAVADLVTPARHFSRLDGALWPGGQYGSTLPAVTDDRQRGACSNCHRVHGWPDPASLTNNYPLLLVDREQNLCYTCHDGSPGTRNVRAQFAKPYSHPITLSGRHNSGESNPAVFGISNRHSECVDCHNPHRATADYASPVRPAAPGSLNGVTRVSVRNMDTNSIVYTLRPAEDPTPVKEYEVCFVCHSAWTTQPSTQTNYAAKFNDNNPSYHPVEAVGKNRNLNPITFVNGWKEDSLMYCTDCHTSDDSTVKGPHGSANRWILKKPITTANTPAMPSTGICYDCHSYSVYSTSSTSTVGSRWRGVSDRPGHTHGGYNCYACHDSHGSNKNPFLLGHAITQYTKTSNGGTCVATCHGSESYTVAYPR